MNIPMLGSRIKRDRNACGYGCCNRTKAPRRRITRNDRARDNRDWKREVSR